MRIGEKGRSAKEMKNGAKEKEVKGIRRKGVLGERRMVLGRGKGGEGKGG